MRTLAEPGVGMPYIMLLFSFGGGRPVDWRVCVCCSVLKILNLVLKMMNWVLQMLGSCRTEDNLTLLATALGMLESADAAPATATAGRL